MCIILFSAGWYNVKSPQIIASPSPRITNHHWKGHGQGQVTSYVWNGWIDSSQILYTDRYVKC